MSNMPEIIVAGHICLDIIPTIYEKKSGMDALLVPGKLVDIGPAILSMGGAVPNTGIALHRLGSNVRLMGKVGGDPFGQTILHLLKKTDPLLVEGMIVAKEESSSYSIVISPPHIDRTFLHSTGVNDTYCASDLRVEEINEAKLFHFGYPPLMKKMYENDGVELALLLQKVKESGLTVSLDLAKPDPESPAGKADWRSILKTILPYVDIFLPSFEEVLYMLDRNRYEQLLQASATEDLLPYADGELLAEISTELLRMGPAIVVLKLGEHGMYVRTTADVGRFSTMGWSAPVGDLLDDWVNGELISSCFEVNVVGTTGAGDCTIAGFLLGITKSLSLKDTLELAVGVGACNVEHADATSGIPNGSDVVERINNDWRKREMKLNLNNWRFHHGVWIGPHHKSMEKGLEANEAQ